MKWIPALIAFILILPAAAACAEINEYNFGLEGIEKGNEYEKEPQSESIISSTQHSILMDWTKPEKESVLDVDRVKYDIWGLISSILRLLGEKNAGKNPEEAGTGVVVINHMRTAGRDMIPVIALVSIFATIWAILSKMCLVPLHTRIQNGDVLNNPVRKKMYEIIRSKPGIRISEVASLAGVGWGTAVYHIMVLEKNGYIASNIKMHSHNLFENNGKYDREERIKASVLRNRNAAKIMEYISSNPGASHTKISENLKMSNSVISWYTQRLCSSGLIRKERSGKIVAHYPTNQA